MTSSAFSMPNKTHIIRLYSLLIATPNGDLILARVLPDHALQLPILRDAGELSACGGIGKWVPKAVMEEYGLCVELIRIETDHHDWFAFLHPSIESVMGRSDLIHPEQRVLVLDVLDENASLRGGVQWIPRDVAMKGNWVQVINKLDIGEWVTQVLEEGSNARLWKQNEPWNNVGWKRRTHSWVKGVLEARGLFLVENFAEVVNSPLSIVLRAKIQGRQTQDSLHQGELEDLYVKASVPIWREAERTMAIRRVLRGMVPEVIAASARDGTMILRDAGPTPSKEGLDKEAVIDLVVKMEKLTMNRIEELKAGGLQVLDEEWVARNVDWILNHDALTDDWDPEFDNITILKENIEGIFEACREVASYKFPKTLVHGDICLRNLGERRKSDEDKYCLYDWDKAFIGNPLLEFWLIASCSMAARVNWIKVEELMPFFQKHWLPFAAFDEMDSLFKAAAVVCGVFDLYECAQLYNEYGSLRKTDMWLSKEEFVEVLSTDLYIYQRRKRDR